MATQVHQVAEDVDNALKDAQEADLDLATALQAAAKGTTEGGSGTLGQAAAQTPTRMDHISPERLAEILGDQVTINTITAYLEMEAEIGSFDFQGKVQGEYRVTADGTTFLALHLWGDLLPERYAHSGELLLPLMAGALAGMFALPVTVPYVMFMRPNYLFLYDLLTLPLLLLAYQFAITSHGAHGAAWVSGGSRLVKAAMLQSCALLWTKQHRTLAPATP